MNDEKSPNRDPRIANLDVIQVWDEKEGRFNSAHTDNISRSGLFILTRDPLPIGSEVRVKFILVSDGRHGSDIELQPVDVRGKVVHRVTEQEATPGMNPGMGISFIDLPEDVLQTIDKIITSGLEPSPTS